MDRLAINYRLKKGKSENIFKLANTCLNSPQFKEEITVEIMNYLN